MSAVMTDRQPAKVTSISRLSSLYNTDIDNYATLTADGSRGKVNQTGLYGRETELTRT